jgi:hypothetical protein
MGEGEAAELGVDAGHGPAPEKLDHFAVEELTESAVL